MTIFNHKRNGKISALIILCGVLGSGTLDATRSGSPSTPRRTSSRTYLGRSPTGSIVRASSSPTLGTSTMASTPEPKATTTVISVGDFRTRFDRRLKKQEEFKAYVAAIKTALGTIDLDAFKRFIADYVLVDNTLNTGLDEVTGLSQAALDKVLQELSITRRDLIRTRIIAFKETTSVYKADEKVTQIYGSSMSVYTKDTKTYVKIDLGNGTGVFFEPIDEYNWKKSDTVLDPKDFKQLDNTLLNTIQFHALNVSRNGDGNIYQLQALIDLKLYKDITHEGIDKRFIVELGTNKYINLGSKTLYTKYDGTIKSGDSSNKTAICLLGTEELTKLASGQLPETLKLTSDTSKEEQAKAATRTQAAFRGMQGRRLAQAQKLRDAEQKLRKAQQKLGELEESKASGTASVTDKQINDAATLLRSADDGFKAAQAEVDRSTDLTRTPSFSDDDFGGTAQSGSSSPSGGSESMRQDEEARRQRLEEAQAIGKEAGDLRRAKEAAQDELKAAKKELEEAQNRLTEQLKTIAPDTSPGAKAELAEARREAEAARVRLGRAQAEVNRLAEPAVAPAIPLLGINPAR